MAVACVSALVSAQTVVLLAKQAPVFRAANAETSISAPGTPGDQIGPSAAIQKSSDGHYWADGRINGASVRFLVDTGATAVALTPQDAQRLGFDVVRLNYTNQVVTAAGHARAASVKLTSLTVSGARLENVDALIIEKGLDTSLLGMTYLGRLSSFQATRNALILQP